MRRRAFSPAPARGGKVFPNSKYGQDKPKRQGQYIDPDKFVNVATPVHEEVAFVPNHSFAEFGLMPDLLKNVEEHGYQTPTPIQDGSIKPALAGKDVIGIANTGTGKTAAFLLPIIHRLLLPENHERTALIMAPTRELALQIDEEFMAFVNGLPLHSTLCVGGVNVNKQIQQLRRRPRVIIGTPGRLKDLLQQQVLHLDKAGILVLDEADRMLDMGFIRDIRFLIGHLPAQRQSLFFSATITPDIRVLMDDILTNPEMIQARTRETSDHVEQNIVRSGPSKEEKLAKLIELLKQPGFERVLVFGQTKWGVQKLADNLTKAGLKAEAIHGNKSQPQRQRALQAFKDGAVNILVATDVASRGLDIPNVSHVINYDQPSTYEDYVHRIGRTGRAGNRGTALTFVSR